MRHRLLVDSMADQRVIDVRDRHQPRRDRDRVARQALGITRAVPFLLMRESDFLGDPQEIDIGAERSLGMFDRVPAQRRVRLHDLKFFGRELVRFQQNPVGNADLADVVQRRRFVEHLDIGVGEEGAKARMSLQPRRQRPHVMLGAADVIAGLDVARLRQRSHDEDGDVLDGLGLLRALFDFLLQKGVLVAQEVRGPLEGELRLDPRQHDCRADRFGDVIHGAEAEASLLVLGGRFGGEEDDRNAACRRIRLQLPADFVTVHARHHDVEQDQLRMRL
jgi:hypothetical protein